MSNIDDIVNVQISIDSPTNSGTSYSALLLVVSAPEKAGATMPTVAKISYASDLSDYGFTETSDAYRAATIAFAQDPRPEDVYVTVRKSEDGTAETLSTTLDRAASEPGWYGFILACDASGSDMKVAADWAEANTKLFGFSWTGSEIPFSITSYNRTFAMYYDGTEGDDAEFGALALMAKCFGYDPGSESWDLKSLATVPVSSLTNAKISELEAIPCMYYVKTANRNCTRNGKVGSGEWIDIIRLRDWLVSEIRDKVFSYLTANKKVPYTDDSITGVQNKVEEVLYAAQRNNAIEADTTDENGNVTKGYVVTVPKAYDISAADKKSRRLKNVTFTARLAGAIIAVTIKGSLTY